MPIKYKVVQSDCIDSISFNYGFMPDTIWNHPTNAELKQKRQNPNILFPGDVVVIPDKTVKEELGTTEQRHRFRRRSVPAFFHLQLLENDQPRAGVEYILEIDGLNIKGVTNDQGRLKQRIPPNAKRGKLYVKACQDWEVGRKTRGRVRYKGF